LRNNFDNGWIGFDERSSARVAANEEMGEPLVLMLRRESSVSLGQLVVSVAEPSEQVSNSVSSHVAQLRKTRLMLCQRIAYT